MPPCAVCSAPGPGGRSTLLTNKKVREEVGRLIDAAHRERVERHIKRQLRLLRRDGLLMRLVAVIRVSRVRKQ